MMNHTDFKLPLEDNMKISRAGSKAWTPQQEEDLITMRQTKTPYKAIGEKVGKTALACRLHYHHIKKGGSAKSRRQSSVTSSSVSSYGSVSTTYSNGGLHYQRALPDFSQDYPYQSAPKNILPRPSFSSGHPVDIASISRLNGLGITSNAPTIQQQEPIYWPVVGGNDDYDNTYQSYKPNQMHRRLISPNDSPNVNIAYPYKSAPSGYPGSSTFSSPPTYSAYQSYNMTPASMAPTPPMSTAPSQSSQFDAPSLPSIGQIASWSSVTPQNTSIKSILNKEECNAAW